MRCDEAINKLNARADGELPKADAVELDAHLAECAQCSSAAEGVQTVDADLRRAFAGRREAASRLAESTATMIRAAAVSPAPVAPEQVRPPIATDRERRVAWWPALAGLAAGFLLAVALFRPWEKKASETVVSAPPDLARPVARLAVASGPVEVLPGKTLAAFTCPTGGAIEQNSIVRTGPTARCEISTADGNALRLDCNTEVKLQKPGIVEIVRGRLCTASSPGRQGLEIQSAGCRVVARPAAQLAFDCQPKVDRVIAIDGAVNVQTGGKSMDVLPGKQLRIVDCNVQDPDWCDPSLETAWVNSLLALKNSDHPEMMERVDRLLANVGAAKLSLMYEDELRRLGDDGVPPLLAYLTSTRDKPMVGERVTAARIVADVAQARWIPDLISLLTDTNAEVRANAARGLKRLTGRDQGFKAEEWKTQNWTTCEGPHARWLKWWDENRDRYPAARREIPPTKMPPF
jgi:hypothetical protein